MNPQQDNVSGDKPDSCDRPEIADTFSQQADGGDRDVSHGEKGNLQRVLRRAAASGAVKGMAGRNLKHLVR